jgi:hypothetical protein
MPDFIERRERLVASDRFAALINDFLNSGESFLEVIDINDSGKVYGRLYSMAKYGGWLKKSVWIRKDGHSTWLYNTEAAWIAAKKEA